MPPEGEARPAQEYATRLAERRERAGRFGRRERWLSNARLVVFLAGAAAGWGILASPSLSGWWLLAPLAAFAGAVLRHEAAQRATREAERAVRFYEQRLARIEHRFAGTGRTGLEFVDSTHPYGDHLDLFGEGSLFELLSAAQTRAGEETLARWLLHPAAPDEVRARQAAVNELRPRLDLREDLALLGPDVRAELDPAALAAWGQARPVLLSPGLRVAAPLLVAVSALGAALAWGGASPLPLLLALGLQGAVGLAVRRRVGQVVAQVDRAAHELEVLARLLARIEREPVTCERLLAIRRALETDGALPSRQVARLRRLVELLDSRRNQLFALATPFLLWTTQCALAIEAWRARCGSHLGQWLGAVGELEALCDLAAYAWEHPADPFPELVAGPARFEGLELGHPLIPDGRCVRNDLALGVELQLAIVSGSNMSGKTTFLRTVGINAVLAQTGAPVRARRLVLSPLAVGASIRVQDSLQAGTSRFYAEITTLRRVAALASGEIPLLFLLDEILQGTNSHDRRIGAAGVLEGLVARGAIGLVTTHDLALARIADHVGPRATNVHFEDELRDGRLHFDYRLRPGVVARSNALELMRAVGLEVPAETA